MNQPMTSIRLPDGVSSLTPSAKLCWTILSVDGPKYREDLIACSQLSPRSVGSALKQLRETGAEWTLVAEADGVCTMRLERLLDGESVSWEALLDVVDADEDELANALDAQQEERAMWGSVRQGGYLLDE